MRQPLRLLVASDLHLSPKIWRHREIVGDSYFGWECICDAAISEEVDAVILAGDVLDKQANHSETIIMLVDGLHRLQAAGKRVLFVQGQHEYQVNPWMSLASAEWINDKLVTLHGWRFAGSDFKQEKEFQDFLKSEAATAADILVCHQVWKNFMGEVAITQGSFEDVPKNVKLLITGDFHEHCMSEVGKMLVLSPGSTHLRSIAEPDEKLVYVVDLVEHGEPQIRSIVLPTRPCVRIDLTELQADEFSPLSEQDIYNTISDRLEAARVTAEQEDLPANLRKPLLYLRHFKDDSQIVNFLAKSFADRAHLFYKPIVETSKVDVAVEGPASSFADMLSYLPDFIDGEDKEAFSLASRLLRDDDPAECLNLWLGEQCEN